MEPKQKGIGSVIGSTSLCPECGHEFTVTASAQKYCSDCGKKLKRQCRTKAVATYNKKAYDRIEMKVPKGSKQGIVDHAAKQGESLNQFLNRAVDNQIAMDNEERSLE